METGLPVIAGMVSTALFAASTLPMVVKAARTRDMASYSIGNLALSNVGNLVHTVYVLSLPPGPIWVLHGFYVVTAVFMLCWYLRHRESRPTAATPVHDRTGTPRTRAYTEWPMARGPRTWALRPMPAVGRVRSVVDTGRTDRRRRHHGDRHSIDEQPAARGLGG